MRTIFHGRKMAMAVAVANCLAVLGSAAPASAQTATLALNPGEATVLIVATGSVTSPATRITTTAQLTTRGETRAIARAANAALFDKVVDALRRAGGDASRVSIVPPGQALGMMAEAAMDDAMLGIDDGELAAELPISKARLPMVRNTISITFSDAALYPKIRDAIEAAGAKSVSPLAYALSDNSTAKKAAKLAALANAQADAKIYADALGLRVVRVLRVAEDTDPQSTVQREMMEVFARSSGSLGIDPGQIKTSHMLTVEFILAPQ
jgi:uncharacterized protein